MFIFVLKEEAEIFCFKIDVLCFFLTATQAQAIAIFKCRKNGKFPPVNELFAWKITCSSYMRGHDPNDGKLVKIEAPSLAFDEVFD